MHYSVRGEYVQKNSDPSEVFDAVAELRQFVPDSKLFFEYTHLGHGIPTFAFRMEPLDLREAQAILPDIPREIGSFRQTTLQIFSAHEMTEAYERPILPIENWDAHYRAQQFREERE